MLKRVVTFLKFILTSESLPENGPVASSRNERFFSKLLQSETLPETPFTKVPARGFLSDILAVEKLPIRNR